MEITSVNNDLVKQIAKLQQKKYRNESGMFLLEGYKAIKEAFDFGIKIDKIFVDKSHINDYDFAKELIIETNETVLKKLCSTDSAPNAVGVAYQKSYDIKKIINLKKIILLENIKDLGNLGTIIRSSVAFGADAIIIYGTETADIYNPKCVRSSVGNLWKIPIFSIKNVVELKEYLPSHKKIATLPRANNLLKTYKVSTPCVIMFGSEADGLSQELIDLSDESIKIEMNENVESLNLATSVSVIMYELFV